MHFIIPVTNIIAKPELSSETLSQGLYGEDIQILETTQDFYLIKTLYDDYKGYIPRQNVSFNNTAPTHYVHNRASLVFSEDNIKSPILHRLPFGSRLRVKDNDTGKFSLLETGGYVIRSHISLLSAINTDYTLADIAETLFLNSPYHWGGKTPDGCDCSGLVQMSAFALGIILPRDSYPQENFLQKNVTHQPRNRNDIIFWQGHVGIMVSATHIIHANAYHMQTVTEPLVDVVARSDKPISSVKVL